MNLIPFLCLSAALAEPAPIVVRIEPRRTVAEVSPTHYGIFFEEINQAGDGGVYAELLRTRGMENAGPGRLPSGWKADGAPEAVTVVDGGGPNPNRRHSLRIGPGGVAVNEGYWGIPVRRGARFRLTVWTRGDGPVRVRLVSPAGRELAASTFPASNGGWRRHEADWTAGGGDPKARLTVAPEGGGSVDLAYASLMPADTWRGQPNPIRPDLGEKVAALRPGFVRFPGGCFVEGHDLAQAFDWKKSIGPKEERAPMPQILWGYPSTNGLGFLEYLQWCEDLGAEPLFVVNCGMSHSEVAPMERMPEYVQSALDAVEYANGPVTSKWGALRAAHGRPEPFRLRYVQIGNENGGPAYDERYAMMARALDERYPELELIACSWFGIPQSYPLEILDEHYYNSPAWFWRQTGRYDATDRQGPRIYVGEYAVTRGAGTGNLDAALAEAAFMTGLLRNADVVRMASYAPLLVNVNNRQWNPNAIVFDAGRAYGTPSYWVQRLFAEHRPDRILGHTVAAPAPAGSAPLVGGVGLQTWRTQAEFRDVELEVDGRTVFRAADLSSPNLEARGGEWSVSEGVLRQTAGGENRRAMLRGATFVGPERMTLRLRARKLGGDEGFIVMFAAGENRELQWNLGGWENTVHAFQDHGDRFGAGVPGSIETGRWYEIRIEREGDVTRGFLDGRLIEEVRDQPVPDFAAVVGRDDARREIVVKAVNGAGVAREAELDFGDARLRPTARGHVLAGARLSDENSFDQPERIAPRPFTLDGVRPRMRVKLAPYSVTVFRFPER